MPTYDFGCPKCGVFERYLPMDRYDEPQVCDCGEPSKKILSTPNFLKKREVNYQSPIDGRPIQSEKARREDMARSGCVEYDPGVKQDYQRRIERDEQKLDKQVDQTVEKLFDTMPARKKELLVSELKSGADVEPVRLTPPQRSL